MTAVLSDVEGTLSSPDFARDAVRPYVRGRLADFLAGNAARPEVAVLVSDAARDAGLPGLSVEEAATVFEAWMEAGLNVTTLLTLEGMIAEEAYRDRTLRGHVYDDAAGALTRWHAAGIPLFVYSETPAPSQRNLFQFSTHGELARLFAGWFDTTIGALTDPGSFRRIVRVTNREPEETLFVSRNPGAIAAAHEAGFRTAWIVRPDTAPTDAAPPCDVRAESLAGLDPTAVIRRRPK